MRFILLLGLLTALAPPAAAQFGEPPQRDPEIFGGHRQRSVAPASFKDPATATLFSVIIVGGGHLYAGETGRGVLLLGFSAAASIGGVVLATADTCGRGCIEPAYIYGGAVLAAIPWVIGIADGGNAARRHNRRHGLVAGARPVMGRVGDSAESSPAPGGGTYLGVAVSIPLGR